MKSIPSVVQLPGGVKLRGVPFRCIEYHEDGSPKLFEILPSDTPTGPEQWVLFANEAQIRAKGWRERAGKK